MTTKIEQFADWLTGEADEATSKSIEAELGKSDSPLRTFLADLDAMVQERFGAISSQPPVKEQPKWLVSLIAGLQGHAASAAEWAESLVQGLIEAGMTPAWSLGVAHGPEEDKKAREAQGAVAYLRRHMLAPLKTAEGFLVTVRLTLEGDTEVRIRSEQGKLETPPSIQFRKGLEVVREVAGKLDNDAGLVLVTDEDLEKALSKGATEAGIVV